MSQALDTALVTAGLGTAGCGERCPEALTSIRFATLCPQPCSAVTTTGPENTLAS